MENLSERFNVLQDQLMNIYETAAQTLEAQIEHWQILRREAVLLYFARQKGVTRLGYQPVPALMVSEAKAKEAIGMVLQLQSLQKSEFGKEPWSLVDTSTETYKSAPENHFKKGPMPIEVIYDKDADNANAYTMWRYIYYVDDDDKWHKSASGVNHTGIYFMHGSFRHYYVLFADDARRYSNTGHWEVKVNKDTVFTPVTSSTPPESPGGQADSNTSSKTPTTDTASRLSPTASGERSQQTSTKGRRYERRPSSRTRRQQAQARQRRSRSKSRSRSRSQSRSRIRSRSRSRSRSESQPSKRRSRSRSRRKTAATRGRGPGSPTTTTSDRAARSPSTTSSATSQRSQRSRSRAGSSRGGRGRGGRRRHRLSESPTSKRSRRESGSVRLHGVSADAVGTSVHTVSSRHTGRLGRLLEEALDPPVILVRGDANTLRSFRNRAKHMYTGLFSSFSTAWSWVAGDGTERLGRSRMLISFISNSQRKHFDDAVRYPKGVDRSFGSFDSL